MNENCNTKMSVFIGIIILFFMCQTNGYSTRSEPQHGYMTHFYFNRKFIQVNDSMVLELTSKLLSDEPGKDFLTCDVMVVTSPGRRLLLHFLSLEISDEDNSIDRLHIFDFDAQDSMIQITPVQGLYGLYDMYYQGRTGNVRDFISTGNKLKLDYQGKPTLVFDGFKILITAVRDVKGDCGRGYVRCGRKDICIPTSTWCDNFHNCGTGDSSDEESCKYNERNAWKPIDGQVTAVIAAASSCTAFLLVIGIVMMVVFRLNKRDSLSLTTNVTVEYKKRKPKKDNREHLARLYAPPSYEVVIGMNEEPPPYHAVADDSDSEISDVDIANDYVATNSALASVSFPENENIDNQHRQMCSDDDENVTSAIITCDIEGNQFLGKSEMTLTDNQNNDFLELTKLHLCATGNQTDTNSGNGKRFVKGASHLDDIEVLESDNSKPDLTNTDIEDENKKIHYKNEALQPVNGHAGKQNGVRGRSNGHLVKYTRSPSGIESIHYMDDD